MFFEAERDKSVYFSRRDHVCGAHFHRSVEILYILSGEKTAWLNGGKYVLTAGQVLFCLPYAVHMFPPAADSEQIVAAIPAEYCGRFEDFCKTHIPETPVTTDEDGSLLKLISALKKTDNDVLFEGLVNCLLGIYMKNTPFSPAKKTPDRSQIERIAEYIDKNYASSLSLGAVAAQFGYSANYFSSLFKKYFMTGFTQYVNSVRVQKSVPLLKTQKISAVYFLCGFQSPQQYFLNFRRFFGRTPNEYLHEKNVSKGE